MREEPLAVLVEQQQQRVLVAEQLGEAAERGADERVEVGTAREALAQLRQPPDLLAPVPELAGHCSATCTAARICSTSTTR